MGGIYQQSTIVEVGEDGPEVILPLSKPARMAELMTQSGITAKGTVAAAGKAAATASRVAAAVAKAINRGLHGKAAKRATKAADTSGAISTLVDFVNGITEALDKFNSSVVPSLSAGWQAKVKSIVKTAIGLSKVIAAEINKAFPWTKGKKKTKKRDAIDPKAGKKGAKLGQAAETSGPIGDLVSFISSISEALDAVVTITVPAITNDVKANIVRLTVAAAELATMIAEAITAAMPAGIPAAVTDRTAAISGVIGEVTDMVTALTEMTSAAVSEAVSGAGNLAAQMPQLTDALKSMLAQFAYALKDVSVSPELAAVSTAISQFVGEITGVVTALTDMTGKTIQDAIWGAGWLAYRAQDLASALKVMLAQMNYAFQGFSIAGVSELEGIMGGITSLVGSTTTMFDALKAMTGKATGAGLSSAQQAGVLFGDLATAGASAGGDTSIGSVIFNISVESSGDISSAGEATRIGREVGAEAIRMFASKSRSAGRSSARRRH
jgi:hypothetical protein